MVPNPIRPSASVSGLRQPQSRTLAMNTERFAGHHEVSEALVLSVAGVTTIMLIESLILLIWY